MTLQNETLGELGTIVSGSFRWYSEKNSVNVFTGFSSNPANLEEKRYLWRLHRSMIKISFTHQTERETQNTGTKTMLKITFKCFSPILNKTFVNVKAVKTMEDFRLYAYSLFSGNWEIISVETN
tara:strand:+ start:807 stop:1178 length:372 start_codon:yes stop_codon:yes gene_type:complete